MVALALLVIVTTYKAQAQIFDFENSHPKSVSLDGQLRFHLGDDPDGKLGWADPAFDDSQWALLGSNSTWGEQGYRDYSGFAWYRFKVILPAQSEHFGILIPRLRTSYEVFGEGKPVGHFGGIPPHGRYVIGFDQIFPIPTDSSSAGHPIVIAIRVWNMDWLARFGGGLEGAPTIGEMDALKALKTQKDWERFWSVTAGNALMLMNLVAAFAGFFLFWIRPADREYLWFGLYELLTGVQHLCTDWVMFYPTGWKTEWLLDDCLATASWLFFLVFVFRILNGRRNWLFWAAVGTEVATMAGIAASLAEWISWNQWRIGALVCLIPYFACILSLLYQRARQGVADAQLMFAPVAVCYFTWFSTFVLGILYAHGQTWVGRAFGWLFQLSRWPFPFSIQDVTDMLMLLAVLAVLPLRFARSRRDEERLAAEMESARTVQQVLIPTDHGSDIFNNYVSSGSQHFDSDQYDGRVDANLFTSYHVFARYTLADFNNYSPAAFGDLAGGPSAFGFSGDSVDRNQSAAVGMDHSLSASLQTDVRLGFYRYRIRVQPNGVGTTPATDAGLPGLNTGTPETSGMPAFYINGNGGFNFGYALGINQCNCPLKETENHFQIVNNWTKQLGNHSLKWGADLRRAQQQRIPSDSHRSGEISFNDSTTGSNEADNLASGQASTGSALASFLIAGPSSFSRYFTGAGFHPGLRQTRLFFFGEDSWRATPKLTINYGLRWEDYLPQTAAKPGGAGSFDPTTGEVLAAGIGSVPSNMGVKSYNLGFAPRVGISYQFFKNSVVRAGVGRSFNPSGLGAVFGQGADYNPPVTNPQSVSQSNPYTPDFDLLAGPPAVPNPPVGSSGRYPLPDGISVYYYTYPPNSYRIPEAYFWNLAVQTEFTNTLAFELAYVGNVGRHLFLSINQNQAVPGPGDFDPRRPFYTTFGLEQALYQTCNCDTSQYNAMQSKLQKRFSHGLDFLLTYTWSKAMDNSEGGGGFANNYDIRGSHGTASWDRTNTVTADYNWDLPFGRNRRWKLGNNIIADAIAGDWRLSGTNNFGSGLPFTPTVSNAPLLNTDFNYVQADIVGDPLVSNPNRNLWFNPSAFSEPQEPYRNGTAGRNSLRGPKLAVSNISIAKNLLPMEGKSLEFRAEAFNIFNHVNLGLPDSTIDGLGAGQITYVQAPMRQMQFALHLRF